MPENLINLSRILRQPLANGLHGNRGAVQLSAIDQQSSDRRKWMACLGGIGNAADATIAIPQAGSALNMGEEDIDLGFCPGNLQSPPFQITLIDLPAIRVKTNASVLLASEHVGGIHEGGPIGIVHIHEIIRAAIEGKTIVGVRAIRNVNIRLIEGRDKALGATFALDQKGWQ